MAAPGDQHYYDYEVDSVNENVENSALDNYGHQNFNKKYRHTPNQIQIMESFFKNCPHPDGKERSSLGQALGLDPLQVKFWFQNKRTQEKAKQKRSENTFLKTQNEQLRAEKKRLKEAASNVSCLDCGKQVVLQGISSPHLDQLKLENARLKKQLEGFQDLCKNYVDKSTRYDPRFSAPLATTPRSLAFELGGSSSNGGQLINNSPEGIVFSMNMQFNVAHSAAPFKEQMILQPKREVAFRTPSLIDEFINKSKKSRGL